MEGLRICRVRAVAVAFVVLANPLAARADALPSHEALVAQFREVVFRTEQGAGTEGKPVVKWATPIAARLHGDAAVAYRDDVEALFKTLANLTGLRFSIAPEGATANLDIRFMPTEEIRARSKLPRINCWGTFSGSRREGLITGAEVLITTDADQHTRHCIVEEIAQILGLPNDSGTMAESIFNDANKATQLPLADQILVRTLYDRRIRPNMTREEAMPIATQVISEMLERLRSSRKAGKAKP